MARRGYVHPSQRAGSYPPTRGQFAGQTFTSYRAYQNAHARTKGFASAATRLAAPRTVSAKDDAAILARPSRLRVLDALNRMRHGESIGKAAREASTTVATVKRYAASALGKGAGGRLVARPSDRYPAVMTVITTAGPKPMVVVGSRSRRLLGEHTAAVRRFLESGDVRHLQPFEGKTIEVDGGRVPLVTDARLLTRLGREGRLSIESIYAKGRGA
jgi:hypothetical protein